MKNEFMMGSCGLACELCNAKIDQTCEGCIPSKSKTCKIKKCCHEKQIDGCFACIQYPCDQQMFQNQRVCAFVEFSKDYGIEILIEALKTNDEKGIKYHQKNHSKGDYDCLNSKDEIKELLRSSIHHSK